MEKEKFEEEKNKLLAELASTQKKLSEATNQIEVANRAKREFLDSMSHEIRTPMNAILGFTRLLKEKIKDEEHQYYLSSILSSGETLLDLINDIQSLPETETGKADPDPNDIRFSPATIVIADDVPNNRNLIRAYLEDYGFNFLEASNGKEAVDLARKNNPELILMDLKMPIMDGRQAIKSLRTDVQTLDIPIIVMTASGLEKEEQEILSICDGYLRKPIKIVELISEITRFLKFTRSESTTANTQNIATETKDSPSTQIYNPGTQEKLPGLINLLQTDFLASWKALDGFFFMKDIKQFVADLELLAKEYQIEMLASYSSHLSRDVARYDIDNLKLSLSGFPELIDQIKDLAN